MRALIWADLHGHNYKEFSETIGGVNSRLLDCVKAVEEIHASAEAEKVDAVFFLGDLFHLKNNLDSHVVKHILEHFAELADAFPMVIIPGNHDYRSWSSDPSLLSLMDEFHEDSILQIDSGWLNTGATWADDLNVYIEPFTRKTTELRERLTALEPKKNSIFLGHQDIIGSQYGGFTVEHGLDADVLAEKFLWSFIGHWHEPGKVKENVISIGAPLQHNFGDSLGARGWWILDTEKGETKLIENTFSPRFYSIKVGSETMEIPGDPVKDFYRIEVKGRAPEILGSIRWKRTSKVVEGQAKARTTISFADKQEDIVEKYVKLRGGDLDHKKLIEIGRRYL